MPTTIAAFSGGKLPAAIGIIRISGPNAHHYIKKIFAPKDKKAYTNCIYSKLYYGKLSDSKGQLLDHSMVALYKGPQSYTGEDMAEIFCHGSLGVVEGALSALYSLGAVPAEAGEFTKRAFFSGKLDLLEAEAVADIIEAPTPLAARAAAAKLGGRLGGEIEVIRGKLTALLSHFFAVCDYTDENIEPFLVDSAKETLEQSISALRQLAATFERGKLIKSGVPVAIIGKPNVGKSSLFNALAGFDRAIVSSLAGTTRDVIDHTISCGDGAVCLFDTAGLRETDGFVENLGIERARRTIDNSQAIMCLFDCSQPLSPEDDEAVRVLSNSRVKLIVFTKEDTASLNVLDNRIAELQLTGALPTEISKDSLAQRLKSGELIELDTDASICLVSAKTGFGVTSVVKWLTALVPKLDDDTLIISSARQAALLEKASADLTGALASLLQGATPDAFLSDAQRAVATLGQLIGDSASPDIAHEIFSRFCVGK